MTYKIMLIDDEESVRIGVSFGLQARYRVDAFPRAEQALAIIAKNPPDLVLLDVGLPGMSGLEALAEIKKINSHIIVIMITAFEDVNTVVRAMKSGARDYIVKPIHMDSLKNTIKNALETIKLRKEVQRLQEKYIRENMPCFIGESQAIQDIMQFVEKVAKSPDAPVLITGESGTGKELIAQSIHYKSPVFQGPFVELNCAAIPRNLMESELFGYEKGAFSGANSSGKRGFVQQAAGGTLFLDEVAELDSDAQAKLLRFLEHGEFFRLGGTQKIRVKTRIISATNKNLAEMTAQGDFRIDLFHRLAVICLNIPSLNDRRDDILPIAGFFLKEISKKYGKVFDSIAADAETFLQNFHWQGNVRELKNMLERGVLVGDGPVLTLDNLGVDGNWAHLTRKAGDTPPAAVFAPLPEGGIDLCALESYYIDEACRAAGGNDRKAASLLGMSYYAFRYRKKKLQKR